MHFAALTAELRKAANGPFRRRGVAGPAAQHRQEFPAPRLPYAPTGSGKPGHPEQYWRRQTSTTWQRGCAYDLMSVAATRFAGGSNDRNITTTTFQMAAGLTSSTR